MRRMDMTRNYKAFISYRHLPLDMSVAKRMHRRIEHFVIPKPLRKNGEKKLGLVFRDQDELPISSSLNDNIRTALDSSEFLIVICSPETVKSEWVLREISYFLEKHDRDHVLAVLADGLPDESFPPQITEVRSPDGELLEKIEPLAANIVADSALKRNALFQTESLRILATLIGCPYDALYRREQRYKRRRILAASSVMLALAAVFIGMLLNRNAQIRNQLRLTQENEAIVLSQLAESEYEKGNYHGAVAYAFQAIPSEEGERPYVGKAEWELNQILLPYRQGGMEFDQSFEQDTNIDMVALSDDGTLAFTSDRFGCARCFDTYSGILLWHRQMLTRDSQLGLGLAPILQEDAVLIWEKSGGSVALFDALSGDERWRAENERVIAVEKDLNVFLTIAEDPDTRGTLFRLRNLKDAEMLQRILLPDARIYGSLTASISPKGDFAAAMMHGSLLYPEEDVCSLMLLDLKKGTLTEIDRIEDELNADVELIFTDSNLLLMAYDCYNKGGETRCYDPDTGWGLRWATETRSADNYAQFINGKILMSGDICVLAGREDGVLVGGLFALTKLDMESGELLWRKTFGNHLVTVSSLKNGLSCVMTSDGTFSSMSAGGALGIDVAVKYFSADFTVERGALTGETFDETVAALVCADYPSRVAIVRRKSAPFSSPLEESEMLSKYDYWQTSPSGELLAAITYDFDSRCVTGELWNLVGTKKVRSFSVLLEDMRFPNSYAVTEDGTLIADGCAIDTEDGTLRSLDGNVEIPARYQVQTLSARTTQNGHVLSAVMKRYPGEEGVPVLVWEDGRTLLVQTMAFPGETGLSSEADLLAMGGNGCVLISLKERGKEPQIRYALFDPGSGHWTEIPDPQATVYALAESDNLLAVQTRNGGIKLYDSVSGTELLELQSSLPALSVKKMLFADGDRELLVFSSMGTMAVFDVESGQLLHKSSYSQYGLSFQDIARYDVFVSDKNNCLVIVYDCSHYTEAVTFVLEREKWECIGGFMGVSCYVPSTNEVILNPYLEGVHHMSLMNTQQLRQMAEVFLDRKPIGEG